MENKKLFIVKEIVSDDNGNLYCDLKIFSNKEESVDYIIKKHEEVYEDMIHYNSDEDEYDVDDDWDESRPSDGFDMSLLDYIEYRVIVSLDIQDVSI